MKPHAALLTTIAFSLITGSASAQCAAQSGVIGGSIRGSSAMDAQAQIDRRNAMYAAQIYQTAARQGAAARARFQKFVATKNAHRQRVQQVAEALGREPRLTKHEQMRLKVIARNQQKMIDRMTRPNTSVRPVRRIPDRKPAASKTMEPRSQRNSSTASQPQSFAANTSKTWARRYVP